MGKGELVVPGRPDMGTRRVTVRRINKTLTDGVLEIETNDAQMTAYEKIGLLLHAATIAYNEMGEAAQKAAQEFNRAMAQAQKGNHGS